MKTYTVTALIKHRRERLAWFRIRARSLAAALKRAKQWLPASATVLDAWEATS